jgi:cell fate (sporulation/competence/biofilm development) regulator YlbF (YheA/YmcA/DUF963 family)
MADRSESRQKGEGGGRDRRSRILDKAQELGRMLGQTSEYEYLQAANKDISDDRDATELLNRAKELQEKAVSHLERGEDPPEDVQEELEEVRGEIQGSPRYQSLVAAQSNFDKLMQKVHKAISEGMKKGEESKIVMPS